MPNFEKIKQETQKESEQENLDDIEKITKDILIQSKQISIESRDRNKEGKLLTRNEGPISNLTEEQWKIVRTEKFKEWFGDWQNPPVKSFKTELGSLYTYDDEKKVSRFKTVDEEQHPRQDITVFAHLSPEDDEIFSLVHNKNIGYETKSIFVTCLSLETNKLYPVYDISKITNKDKIYLSIIDHNKNKIIKQVKAHIKPIVGLTVFELRTFEKDGKKMLNRHLGHKVTDVEYDYSNVSKFLDKNGEPRSVINKDNSVSFINTKNPFILKEKDCIKNWIKQNNLESYGEEERFNKFINYIKSQGYDGLIDKDRKPIVHTSGKKGFDKNQVITIKN